MVEMSCEEHDQMAASTQFITHTVGRMLGAMQVRQGGRQAGPAL
jgi:arogenate dehydrogenase (NADP+)